MSLLRLEGIDQSAWIVPLERVIPDPSQPRRSFDQESLQDLANDIKLRGIRSPLTVSRKGSEFHLIAGERRYRAAKLAGLSDVPVRVIEPENVLEEQLIENLQREDLNPVDEAVAIGRLRDQYKLSMRDLASRLNKSKSTIERILKILEMSKETQDKLRTGEISFQQAEIRLVRPNSKAKKSKKTVPTYSYKNRSQGAFQVVIKYNPQRSDKAELIGQLQTLIQTLQNS